MGNRGDDREVQPAEHPDAELCLWPWRHMAESQAPPNAGYLTRAHRALTIFGLFYVVAIGLLGVPWVQRQ